MSAAPQEDLFALIQDPLRLHALHDLPAASLAHLRRANGAAQLLVDYHTGSIWKAAASELVEDSVLPSAEHSQAVQAKLRQQGAMPRRMRAGEQLPFCKLAFKAVQN